MPPALARFPVRLAVIAGVALVLRVIYTVALGQDARGVGDLLYYHGIAGEIADGHGFVDPFLSTEQSPYPSALHPPLWPVLLAAASKVGLTSMLAHRLVGCVVGVGTVVLIGLIGRRVAGERVGLIAAGVAALYPTLIAADGSLMSETLYGLFVAIALLLAYRLLDHPGAWTAAALGASIGAASLVRGEGVLFVFLLALPVAWRGGRPGRVLRMGVTVLATVLVLAPWTIRNHFALDAFVPISTNESTLVAGANCADTYRGEDLGYWRLECISKRRRGAGEAEQADVWRSEGRGYATDHLARLIVVVPVRVLRSFDLFQARRQARFAEGRNLNVTRAGVAAFYALLLLAVAGVVTLYRRHATLLVLLSPFAVVVISSAAGFGLPRFRHAAEIAVVVLAAVAADAWLRRREAAPARSRGPSPSGRPGTRQPSDRTA